MIEIVTYETYMLVDEDDIFIQDENCSTKLKVYKDDGNVWFNALTPDGVQRFRLNKKMTKELIKKLAEVVDD